LSQKIIIQPAPMDPLASIAVKDVRDMTEEELQRVITIDAGKDTGSQPRDGRKGIRKK
jgi:hypothetical protein